MVLPLKFAYYTPVRSLGTLLSEVARALAASTVETRAIGSVNHVLHIDSWDLVSSPYLNLGIVFLIAR